MPFVAYPPAIMWRRDCLNHNQLGQPMYPSSSFLARCVAAENHLTAHRHGEAFSCDWRLGSLAHAITGAGTTLRYFRFRASVGATRLRAYVVLGKCGPIGGSAATTSSTKIDVTISGGATTTMGPWQHPITADTAPTDGPSSWHPIIAEIAITPGTVYECAVITTNFARPLSISVYELGATTTTESVGYYNQRAPQAGSPLYDADRERLLVGVDAMLRANGGTRIHFGMSTGAARTRTSATPINLVDNTTTGAPTAATPGVHLDMTYRNTSSRSTVPFELAIYGSTAASGAGRVRLVGQSAGTIVDVPVDDAAAQWFVETCSLPAGADKYDLQFYGDGVNLTTIYAASLVEWEA